jgi:hypothetical protein
MPTSARYAALCRKEPSAPGAPVHADSDLDLLVSLAEDFTGTGLYTRLQDVTGRRVDVARLDEAVAPLLLDRVLDRGAHRWLRWPLGWQGEAYGRRMCPNRGLAPMAESPLCGNTSGAA